MRGYPGDKQLFRIPRSWNAEGVYTQAYGEGRQERAPELSLTASLSWAPQSSHSSVSLTHSRIDTAAPTPKLLAHIRCEHTLCAGTPTQTRRHTLPEPHRHHMHVGMNPGPARSGNIPATRTPQPPWLRKVGQGQADELGPCSGSLIVWKPFAASPHGGLPAQVSRAGVCREATEPFSGPQVSALSPSSSVTLASLWTSLSFSFLAWKVGINTASLRSSNFCNTQAWGLNTPRRLLLAQGRGLADKWPCPPCSPAEGILFLSQSPLSMSTAGGYLGSEALCLTRRDPRPRVSLPRLGTAAPNAWEGQAQPGGVKGRCPQI